jgi:Pentapeptide repeats (8 copies)
MDVRAGEPARLGIGSAINVHTGERARACSRNVLPVLKPWATWPRGIRWLAGGIVAVIVALASAWLLFMPAADWLARQDAGSASGALLQPARDAARGQLLALGAGLFAAGALIFTARNVTLARRAFELIEQGQVTDRYTRAVEQLGSDKLDVRVGGIYALERVARHSARDQPMVMEVLAAFIREHSREQWPPSDRRGLQRKHSMRPDLQAAITVVGRRDVKHDIQPVDLTAADLSYARLTGANLTAACLGFTDLSHAYLSGATFSGGNLLGANLRGAVIDGADFTGADLAGADLTIALAGTSLPAATFDGANLTAVKWPEDGPVPDGWKRDTGSGRLVEARTDSGPRRAELAPSIFAVPVRTTP